MSGLLVGLCTFLLIGIFHPIVIKCEYHFGSSKPNIFFVIGGIIFAVLSVIVGNVIVSILLGVVSCCCFWSIKEVKEQEVRVLKGWFPENPQRSSYYASKREEFYRKNGYEINSR